MTLRLHLSGGPGNTDPQASLGGVRSTTTIVDALDNNLFDDINRKEVIIGKTEYRCYYIYNDNATTPVHGAFLFIDDFPDISTVTIGLDPVGSGNGTTEGVAQTISTEDTTPTGVTFENAGEFIVKLSLPTLKSLESQAIWVKRIAQTGKSAIETLGITVSGNEETLPTLPAGSEIHSADGLNLAGERTIFNLSPQPFKIGTARVGFSQIE